MNGGGMCKWVAGESDEGVGQGQGPCGWHARDFKGVAECIYAISADAPLVGKMRQKLADRASRRKRVAEGGPVTTRKIANVACQMHIPTPQVLGGVLGGVLGAGGVFGGRVRASCRRRRAYFPPRTHFARAPPRQPLPRVAHPPPWKREGSTPRCRGRRVPPTDAGVAGVAAA